MHYYLLINFSELPLNDVRRVKNSIM